jgi:type I restriction enzyme R subunit
LTQRLKIKDFFDYVRTANEGERLIVKIKSQASEAEIYDDFAKLYRRYRALNRRTVGDYFFKEWMTWLISCVMILKRQYV